MAGRIYLVGSIKGGAGKTTLAANLAVYAAQAGGDVLLVDTDPGQRSAAHWAARRAEDAPELKRIDCIELTQEHTMRHAVSSLASRYRTVIIDTGAIDGPALRACALLAHCLVYPLQPDGIDLWALPALEDVVVEATRRGNTALQTHLVLNRVLSQAAHRVQADVTEWMGEHVPRLPCARVSVLQARAAYGRAIGRGLAVSELRGRAHDAKAAAEFETCYFEVFTP